MKKLILFLVMSPLSVFAGTVLQTKVHCTTADSKNVFAQTIQSNQYSHIALSEYTLWPLKLGENKALLISKIGVQGTYARVEMGSGASTSTFFELPQADGTTQKCIVLMTKEAGEDRYIFEI